MMTREEAKTKVCPIKLAINPPVSYEMALCLAEDCPKWMDFRHVGDWCSLIEIEINEETDGFSRICISNMCGKKEKCLRWKQYCEYEIDDKNNPIHDTLDFEGKNHLIYFDSEACYKCRHRYGYCGG